jgi:biopolymer transport protein ExbB
MAEPLFALRRFFDAGGPILGVIFLVAVALWMLIIERYWYHWRLFPRELAALHGRWRLAPCPDRRLAEKMRFKDLSVLRQRLSASLPLIRTLIAVCPLLGLLGTVTGMIHVFDTLGFNGTGNPRAMAAGVSMATIPTMSGLVVALSGFLFSIRLQRGCESRAALAAGTLTREVCMGCTLDRAAGMKTAGNKEVRNALPTPTA